MEHVALVFVNLPSRTAGCRPEDAYGLVLRGRGEEGEESGKRTGCCCRRRGWQDEFAESVSAGLRLLYVRTARLVLLLYVRHGDGSVDGRILLDVAFWYPSRRVLGIGLH